MTEKSSLSQFAFQLVWAGARMGFSEVSGLTQERRKGRLEGDVQLAQSTIVGFDKSLTITLKRGIVQTDDGFSNWLSAIRNEGTTLRHDATLRLYNEYREVLTSWHLTRCFPNKIEGPSFKATGNEVAMESLEIVHDGLQVMTTTEAVRDLLAHHSSVSGFRVLFHGPAGGGRVATVSVLGEDTNHEIIRVDLSHVISKYIGETEKNLTRLFAQAERANAILFFDEADALFGKRTGVTDAHDKYANQEVSYVLHRIERYQGIVVLATLHRPNIDNPFLRRMQMVIPFPVTR